MGGGGDKVEMEYLRPRLLQQRAAAMWPHLRLLFLGAADPGCIIAQLDMDTFGRVARATVAAMLEDESDSFRGDARAAWHTMVAGAPLPSADPVHIMPLPPPSGDTEEAQDLVYALVESMQVS